MLYCYMCNECPLLSDFWLAVTSEDFHTIGYVISVDPARKSLGYQGQSSRVNQEVLQGVSTQVDISSTHLFQLYID